MQHSYACCWRHKTPIIFRATPQWFSQHRSERSACAVTERDQRRAVDPGLGPGTIEWMVANRPDWCISRQRTWAYRCHCSCTRHGRAASAYPRTDGRSG
ncbi:class I tRNA ligase family protein [Escherichia coli]